MALLATMLPGQPASASPALRGLISLRAAQAGKTIEDRACIASPSCCLSLSLLRLQLLLLPLPRPHLCVAHLARSPARLQNR